jgi:hypothetical protein
MWISSYPTTINGTKYNLQDLDFLINEIGFDIELHKDASELKKDEPCQFHFEHYLLGITNGEYIYAVYEIIQELTSDKASGKPNSYKKAILHALIHSAWETFIDTLNDDKELGLEEAKDCWELYKVCCKNQNSPIWVDHNNKPISPPKLGKLSIDDWEYVCEEIEEEFITDYNWYFQNNYRDDKEQPYKPTPKEYKKAVSWLLEAYSNTRLNCSLEPKIKNEKESSAHVAKQTIKRHELFDFMNVMKGDMLQEYQRIQKRVIDDPGTAGDQCEENWATFLRQWLPANYPIVTKGRILTHDNWASPQVDIIVLYPHYPLHLRDKKVFFAGGVAAAFECKLTLRNNHIKDAFRTAALIKRRMGKRSGNIYDELQQPIIYGLLAHSHSWKKKGWKERFNILDKIASVETEFCEHPRELVDIICVAETATYYLDKFIHIGPHANSDADDKDLFKGMKDGGIATCYYTTGEDEDDPYDSSGEILGRLILEITKRLAYEDSSLQHFVDYLYMVTPWSGIGRPVAWNKEILSKETLKMIMKKGYINTLWSKWAEQF